MSSGVLPDDDDQPVAIQPPESEHTSVNAQKQNSPAHKPDRSSTVFLTTLYVYPNFHAAWFYYKYHSWLCVWVN